MNDQVIVVPDFYPRLEIQPGRELAQFPSRLCQVIELRNELSKAQWQQRCKALDDLYKRHKLTRDPDNFAQAMIAEESVTDPGDEQITRHEIGRISFLSSPTLGDKFELKVNVEPMYYGYGTETDMKEWVYWSAHSHIDPLFDLASDECQNSGGMRIPAHWTPSTLTVNVHNGLWKCRMRDEYIFYMGIDTPAFADLLKYAAMLFVSEASPWLIEGNGQKWNQREAADQTAFVTWDTAMSYYANERFAEAIDTLRILHLLGCFHPRVKQITREFLKSNNVSVRHTVAGMLLADSIDVIFEPTLPADLISDIVSNACAEPVRAVAENLIHTLRLQGGEASYDALMEVAQNAASLYARDAASRALAWVPRHPERIGKLSQLAGSRNRQTSRAAMNALKEFKMHGLFSREGEFASAMERSIHQSFVNFFSSRGDDKQAAAELEDAFKNKFVHLEIEGVPGTPDCKVTVMTCNDVPLQTESVRTLQFCGLLNRLPSIDIPSAMLSDEELDQEEAMHKGFSGSEIQFQGRQRRLIGQALTMVDPETSRRLADYINQLIEHAETNEITDLVLSLEDKPNIVDAFLLVLEALPDLTRNLQNLLIKGPDTGMWPRIEKILSLCPLLETFWGYVNSFPENGSDHMECWNNIKIEPAKFTRDKLQGLDGSEFVVLWSRMDGHQPPM